MQADKTTLNDLAIFSHNEEHSVLHHIDFTRTVGGREWLRFLLSKPLKSLKEISGTQQLIKRIITVHSQWPQNISNGTILVLNQFYESAFAEIPQHPNQVSALAYVTLNRPDYSLIKYSVQHFVEFARGMQILAELLDDSANPPVLQTMVQRITMLVQRAEIKAFIDTPKGKILTQPEVLQRGFFFRRKFKDECLELVEIYNRLDAYYSFATACIKFNYVFPDFIDDEKPHLQGKQLWHPLLQTPTAYDVSLTPAENFLFLTGANMAGKSTFIKAIGLSTYLAHIGMGVPAQSLRLTFFDGLLSNIQVEDNIMQGESYFFNEVQRIRKTIEKISDGKKWLILIDELFKGTNVQDAMKCSSTVIEGLLKIKNAVFVLSTHLYEIGEGLKRFNNIQFRYFETGVQDGQLLFSYQLKEGISNDRLGYLILKREGVVDLLQKL